MSSSDSDGDSTHPSLSSLGLGLRLEEDIARYDELLAELRRQHESVARQLRAVVRKNSAGLRGLARQADEAVLGPAPNVPVPDRHETPAEPRESDGLPSWIEVVAWAGGSGAEARAEGFAIFDPTESDTSGAISKRAGSDTPSGAKNKQKQLNRAFSSTILNPEDTACEKRSACYRFVTSPPFELIWSTFILLNTLTMALEAQYDGIDGSYRHDLGRSPSTEPASEVWPGADTLFVVADMIFGVIFTFELLWRGAVLRKQLFSDPWSWIDITAVTVWYAEKFLSSLLPVVANGKFIRFARLVKLLRFVRVIRFINAFEKLYLILASLKSSFSALAWSSAVLLLVEMVFALLLNILLEGFWDNASNPMEDRQAIYQHFGTFSKSLLSMFEMLLGNWYGISRELVKVSEWYMIFGVGHQLAFGFAVIEVMTGVFLHETFHVAAMDDGIMANETKRTIQNNTDKMKIFFENADLNGDGYLDKKELDAVLQKRKVQEWLSGMGLDIQDVSTAFAVMDKDGDGKLSAEEFVQGALLLKGQSRAIEVAVLRNMLEEIRARV